MGDALTDDYACEDVSFERRYERYACDEGLYSFFVRILWEQER